MTRILLDTNAVSELANAVPNPSVVSFFAEQGDLWLSSVVIYELEYGLQLLPEGRRRRQLSEALSGILSAYGGRILSLDRPSAEWAAIFRAQARRSGRTMDVGDSLIAGIARANAMSVATRNVRDFAGLGLEIVNPWEWQ